MTIPSFDSVRDLPVASDADLAQRLSLMLATAVRRQVWLMFLDEDDRQLPVIVPNKMGTKPRSADATALATYITNLCHELNASSVVITYERRGREAITDSDRAWLLCLRNACVIAGVRFRGPFLCHNYGVIQVAPDEYLA